MRKEYAYPVVFYLYKGDDYLPHTFVHVPQLESSMQAEENEDENEVARDLLVDAIEHYKEHGLELPEPLAIDAVKPEPEYVNDSYEPTVRLIKVQI